MPTKEVKEIKVSEVKEGMVIRYFTREPIKVREIFTNPHFGCIGFGYGRPEIYYNFFGWFKPDQTLIVEN